MLEVTSVPIILASLALVGLALALAWWLSLGVQRDIVVASARAAVQLVAVGLLFTAIFASSRSTLWAWLWVAAMLIVATFVLRRRAPADIKGIVIVGGGALLLSVAMSLAVTFGFGVLEFDPVSLVVIAGITIGNAMPSAVLGANQAVNLARDKPGEIEATLALGFTRAQTARYLAPRAARSALIPQVERTKVVGLIALPGAMTGLLLAGVDPIDAVVIQLLVMYLVLGSAALSVVSIVAVVSRAAVSGDLRLAQWARTEPRAE